MANMWSGKDYWKHFVGFADRSNAAGITETNLENATTFEVISGDKRTLHGTKDKRSDTSKLQYGTNYTEQYGDSISVQEGNKSSIQSQGWSNSVMNGISFSTTSGGSFASIGGFSIATHLGFKMATFGGFDLSTNLSGGIKIAHGYNFNYDLAGKTDLTQNATTVAAAEAKFAKSVNNVVAGRLTHLAGRIDAVTFSIDYKATQLNTKVLSLQNDATVIQNKFTTMASQGVSISYDCVNAQMTAAGVVSVTGMTIKLG